MAEAKVKIQKKVDEEITIPVPSYWKHKKKSSDTIHEFFAVISPDQVVNVWLMTGDKPSASISVRALSMVSEFATDELEETDRASFNEKFAQGEEIHAILLSFR